LFLDFRRNKAEKALMTPTSRIDSTANTAKDAPRLARLAKRKAGRDYTDSQVKARQRALQ
jgi:hypothetical protein